MSKLRKYLAITASLALLLAACGTGDDPDVEQPDDSDTTDDSETTDDESAASDPVSLNVLVESGGLQLQQEAAEQFEAETGHTINFVEAPYEGVFDRLVAEASTGGASFDVATVDVIWLPTFADFAEPLDDLFTDEVVNDLFPALVEDAQIDGTYVGMPAWANAEVLFYRTDLFEDPAEQDAFEAEYGYELAPPTTWEEFTDIAQFFTRDDLYGTDVKGAVETEWLAHVLQAGADSTVLDADGNVIIDDDEHIAALEFYTDLHCEYGVSPSGVAQMSWGEAQNQFYQGQTAMMRFWAHAYRLTPDDSVVEGSVGVAPMIGGPGGVGAIPGPWYNIVPSSGNNVEVAKEFVSYLYEHNAMGIEAPLGLAARISAYEEYAGQEGFEHFEPLIETLNAEQTSGRPLVPEWQQITDEVLIPVVQEATSCERAPADILRDARSQVESIM
jgi:ABC-type glycerol-3-phosphate transport system substrate-binding protein